MPERFNRDTVDSQIQSDIEIACSALYKRLNEISSAYAGHGVPGDDRFEVIVDQVFRYMAENAPEIIGERTE